MQTPFRSPEEARVLIVDDAPMIITMLSTLLMSLGFRQIVTADSVKTGLEKVRLLEHHPFDIIFLDLYLRDGTGHEILKSIRAHNKTVPIFILTQEDEASKVLETIAQGASDYIVKPFTHELVVKKLERALGGSIQLPSTVL